MSGVPNGQVVHTRCDGSERRIFPVRGQRRMARLLENLLGTGRCKGLGFDEVEISHDLFHVSPICLVFDPLASQPAGAIENANFRVVLCGRAQAC